MMSVGEHEHNPSWKPLRINYGKTWHTHENRDQKVWKFSTNNRVIVLSPKLLTDSFDQRESRNHISRQTPDKYDKESFHRAIGPTLAVAQIFGILPVSGLLAENSAGLRFRIISFKTFYLLPIICCLSIRICTAILRIIRILTVFPEDIEEALATSVTFAVFYGNSFCEILIFFWLAPRWIKLQRQWSAMEKELNSIDQKCLQLRWKLNTIALTVLILGLIEHIIWYCVVTTEQGGLEHFRIIGREFIKAYSKTTNLLYNRKVTLFVGFCLNFTNLIATFTWNFTDLFLMLVSTGLAERYKCLNKIVIKSMTSNRHPVHWLQLRKKYTLLRNLVTQTDSYLSPLLFLSFAINLYFICLQLFNGLRLKSAETLKTIYFFGSFAYLVGRISAVTLLAARIHDQSKNGLTAVYSSPASCFTIETDRLISLLTTDDVSLTGMKFFSITRNFMLAIAGAIATYEVVLLQFHASGKAR